MLTVLHLPIALWLMAVGVAYVGGRWFSSGRRMDFVRFSGELAIYYVLIALGGGVVTAFTAMLFSAIDMNPAWFIGGWLIPCGAAGAVIIGSWLVEAKQSVIENMAPVLTRLFTPLFTILLLAFLATMAWTGNPINVKREVLIGFDLLLAVVVGLVLYAASARDPQAPPDFFDGLQLLLVVSALVVDVVALAAIAARISEFGFTPNRVAALGENLILLVNLAWTAWLYASFLRHRGSFAALERWQIAYLPVCAVWAALVVVMFPPVFGTVDAPSGTAPADSPHRQVPGAGLLQDVTKRDAEAKVIDANDMTHVFKGFVTWELPFGKGRRFLDRSGITDALLGGWQLSMIFKHFTGTPMAITSSTSYRVVVELRSTRSTSMRIRTATSPTSSTETASTSRSQPTRATATSTRRHSRIRPTASSGRDPAFSSNSAPSAGPTRTWAC